MTSRIFRSYSPRFVRTLKLGALVLAAGTGYAIHAARAAGVPSAEGIAYAGVATDGNGTPLSGNQNIGVAVWSAVTAGTKVCEFPSALVPLDSEGNFRIVMDDCADDMHASANLWVEVSVNGSGLGRTKIGAVPYALEAANAVQADLASDSDLLEGKPASDFAYSAGGGLSLSAQNQFSVDYANVQRRVAGATGQCAAGSSIRAFAQDGTATCEPDTDTDTTYTAGAGLVLQGGAFALAPAEQLPPGGVLGSGVVNATADYTTPEPRAFCALSYVRFPVDATGTTHWCTVTKNANGTWTLQAAGSTEESRCMMYCTAN